MYATMIGMMLMATPSAAAQPDQTSLRWDAVASSSDVFTVSKFDQLADTCVWDDNSRQRWCATTITKICIDSSCYDVEIGPLRAPQLSGSGRFVEGAFWGIMLGLGGAAGVMSSDGGVRIVGGLLLSGAAGSAAAPIYLRAASQRRISHLLSENLTASMRLSYVEKRTSYLHLRDQYVACIAGSTTPLTPSPADRSSARTACDAYVKQMGQQHSASLRADFAEASNEVTEAVAAWELVPMLQRLTSGDYLGFYQNRDSVHLGALPAPVGQDVCDRVRDATGGKAIADDLLRKKLKSWAAETCPGGE